MRPLTDSDARDRPRSRRALGGAGTDVTGHLAELYFRPRAFEANGRLYEWLGVVAFKRLLLRLARTDARGGAPKPYFLAGRSPDDLRAFEKITRRNEVIHLVAMVPAAGGLVLAGLDNAWLAAALALVLVANFHPFVLQRYNRIRIRRVLERGPRRGPRDA